MLFNQPELSAESFLRHYWQKKPLLLRQAFPGFEPVLDADDIAGLACDELAESRLITGLFQAQDWSLRYGPFSAADFAALPAENWTLLVQDVEKHYPPLRELISEFSFIPHWRIDDLMVSVAGPGGSVGPHVDQYDVFLLQATGHRRWEIASDFDPELLPDCELNVLRRFTAQDGWDLDPGDMLYLPPGVAHHGIALAPSDTGAGEANGGATCMTWSVGMRAPSAADLLQALGEWLAELPTQGGRYRDGAISPAARAGEIDATAISGLREMLQDILSDRQRFPEFLADFLSRYRMAHEPAPPPHPIGRRELLAALNGKARLRQNPWTRLDWVAQANGALLFAAGTGYRCTADIAELLCDPGRLVAASTERLEPASDLICELVNRGHLVFERL
jgi:50S ribosomal protein L16 3-hydroxylase